jgi:predicted alpha/beta superfamily hydrolase
MFSVAIFLVIGCTQPPAQLSKNSGIGNRNTERVYSKFVADSFSISISLPIGYDRMASKKYPVVYLLDGNLYFDIVAVALNKYSEVGLAPEVILVGIGYKDFSAMDSLRTRDDTYPEALPEYEMSVSGGGDKFLSFLNKELVPKMDNKYKTDHINRILMGHSLGGYFTSFALLNTLTRKGAAFNGFIAASPSLHYNKYYLLSKFKELSQPLDKASKLKAYITFGGLEDGDREPGMMKLKDLSSDLAEVLNTQSKALDYKVDLFSNLGHMDTQLPTFIKGLQWMLKNK